LYEEQWQSFKSVPVEWFDGKTYNQEHRCNEHIKEHATPASSLAPVSRANE